MLRSEVILNKEVFAISQPGKLPGEHVDIATLAELPLIVPSHGHGLRMLIDDYFAEHETVPRIAMEIDSFSSIKALVARGHGASLLPMHAVADELSSGQMEALPVREKPFQRNILLAYQSTKPMTRCQSAIHGLLRTTMIDVARSGGWPGANMINAAG